MTDRAQTPEERAARERPIVAPLTEQLPPPLDWEKLEEKGEPPERDWAIENWIGMGHVTLLAGRGGIGKSIIAQQMGTALALGKEFVGPVRHPRTVLMWAGEDDHDELWRRQLAVCKRFDVPLGALRGRLHIEPLAAVTCSLMDEVAGEIIRTSMLAALKNQIEQLKAEVVILDNIAKLYGAGENDRHAVSSFMAALNWAAEATGSAVLLLGHVAKGTESEYSGSTAWENAARGRLWLTDKPPDKKSEQNDEEDVEPLDLRYLAKRKVNYSSRDIAILRYTDGAYDVVNPPSGGIMASIDREKAKRIVLAAFPKLETMGLQPNESTASPAYLPKLIVQHKIAEGFNRGDLAEAMRSLMTDGVIKRDIIGKHPNRTPKYGLVLVSAAAQV